jgi:hypothetical protein
MLFLLSPNLKPIYIILFFSDRNFQYMSPLPVKSSFFLAAFLVLLIAVSSDGRGTQVGGECPSGHSEDIVKEQHSENAHRDIERSIEGMFPADGYFTDDSALSITTDC